jgi:hypothetical protein
MEKDTCTVLKSYDGEIDDPRVYFTGTYDECKAFIRTQRWLKQPMQWEIAYASGRLASYVL